MKVVGADVKYILDTDHPLRKRWTIFMYLLVLYSALQLPFSVAFRPPESVLGTVLEYTVDALFLVDVVMNFRMSFHMNGQYVPKLGECFIEFVLL